MRHQPTPPSKDDKYRCVLPEWMDEYIARRVERDAA
jgi:hypothetical protein